MINTSDHGWNRQGLVLGVSSRNDPSQERVESETMLTQCVVTSGRIRGFQPLEIPAPRSPRLFPADELVQSRPIDLEIGCGAGWHPIQYASKHPDRVLIAIEHTRNRFAAFEQRAQNHPELTNLYPVHDNAIHWITHRVPRESISRLFLLYPNPNPRHRDLNRRWFGMPFFGRLLESLKSDGELMLVTNEAFYFEEAQTLGQSEWGLKVDQIRQFQAADQPAPRTHFEKKYLERGQTCFEIVFRKRSIRNG